MNTRNARFTLFATILWLLGIFGFYILGLFERPTSFNELGDFLAGVFAPVAFLWLIYGYFQNSEALQAQIEEMSESVKQQKEMIKIHMNAVKPRVKLLDNGTAQLYSNNYGNPVYKFNMAFENVGGGDAFNIELKQVKSKDRALSINKLNINNVSGVIEKEFYLVLFYSNNKRHKQFNVVLTYEDIHQKKYQQDLNLILLGDYNKPDDVLEIFIKKAHVREL